MAHDTFGLRCHSLFECPLKTVALCKAQITPELWTVVCCCSFLVRVPIPLGHAPDRPWFLTICFLYESLDSCHTLTLCPLRGCCEETGILSWRNVSTLRDIRRAVTGTFTANISLDCTAGTYWFFCCTCLPLSPLMPHNHLTLGFPPPSLAAYSICKADSARVLLWSNTVICCWWFSVLDATPTAAKTRGSK